MTAAAQEQVEIQTCVCLYSPFFLFVSKVIKRTSESSLHGQRDGISFRPAPCMQLTEKTHKAAPLNVTGKRFLCFLFSVKGLANMLKMEICLKCLIVCL